MYPRASLPLTCGFIFLPLMATQRAPTKEKTTFSTLSGASFGQHPISGSTISIDVSTDSRSSASWERPARLASVEYFFFGPTKASMPKPLR